MMNRSRTFLFFLGFSFVFHSCIKQVYRPVNHPEIDRVRKEVRENPTNDENETYRRHILNLYNRLMMFSGADLSGYDPVLTRLMKLSGEKGAEYYRTIDTGYIVLNSILDEFKWEHDIINPDPLLPKDTSLFRDWPLFHGDRQQTGYTTDPGPVRGVLSWKFPVGRAWYARPLVKDGRIYIASPGLATNVYCFDECSGKIIWKSFKTDATQTNYNTSRMSSSVWMKGDSLILREVGSGGNKGAAKEIIFVNKKNGAFISEIFAGHVDYRVGYAPLELSGEYLIIPYGLQEISGNPEVYSFNNLVCKSSNSGIELWNKNIGEFYGEPAVDSSVVYQGTFKGKFHALELATGAMRWSFDAMAPINGKASIYDSNVFFGAENGILYCLDKNTGRVCWQFNTGSNVGSAFQQFSQPLVTETSVYAGTAEGFLYSLDRKDGRLNWKFACGDWVRSMPAKNNDHIFVATVGGKVIILKDNGKTVDKTAENDLSGHQLLADLVVSGNNLLVSSSGMYLYCLDGNSGEIKWKQSLIEAVEKDDKRIFADFDGGGSDYQSPPSAAEGLVFIGGPDRFCHAVDHKSGKEVWRFETRGQVSAQPVYSNGRIYFGQQGGDDKFYCLNAKTGDLIWSKSLGWVWASAGIAEGRIFVPAVSGICYCLSESNGDILWQTDTGDGAYPAPASEDGVVIFGSWNDYYYAFDIQSGNLLWKFDTKGNPDSGASLLFEGRAYLQALYGPFVYCVDVKTGGEIWKFPVNYGQVNVSPSIFGDALYLSEYRFGNSATLPSYTYRINKNTGKLIWKFKGGGGLTGPSLAGGMVLTASTKGPWFYALSQDNAYEGVPSVVWRYRMGGRVEESCPAIAYGKAYVLVNDGYLYAFE